MQPYKIVLTDDHTLMREGIKQLIQNKPDFLVIGEAEDGLALLKLLNKARPDMVILDISMPGMRGIEAAREIRNRFPEINILMLSMHKNREFLTMSLAVGVNGYLLKEDSGDELLLAIGAIRSGRRYLSAKLTRLYSTELLDILDGHFHKNLDPLTPREREILKLIAEGNTDRDIANLLFISIKTVQRHHYNIRQKLKLKRTADIVKYAISNGYISSHM